MSEAVFPDLASQAWPVVKIPEFKTGLQESVAGGESAVAYWSYPRWTFKLKYDLLKDTGLTSGDLQTVLGFFLARKARFDTFLFYDKDDHTATNQLLGVGTGAKQDFQMIRSYAGFLEPVLGIKTITQVTVAGVPTVAYSCSTTGLLHLNAAPAAAQEVRATFDFYYRCRFLEDMSEFSKFAKTLWENGQIQFRSVK